MGQARARAPAHHGTWRGRHDAAEGVGGAAGRHRLCEKVVKMPSLAPYTRSSRYRRTAVRQAPRRGSRASPTDSSLFTIRLLSCPALPRSQSGTLRRTPLPRRRARPVALPACPDRPERPKARPGLDYLVAMAPSILISIGFFLLSHQASALGAQLRGARRLGSPLASTLPPLARGHSNMSHEPSNPTLLAEAPSAGTIRTRRTLSPLSPSRASLVSREWTTKTAFCSRQISPADRRRDSSPSMVSAKSSSRSTASAHSASRSASTSCSRACFSARHRSICSSILRSTPSIRSVLPSISSSFPWAARDADDGLLLLGLSHLTTFRPVFSLLWVALVGHLVASGPPAPVDRPVASVP
jgi:hypothetical protein